MAQLVCLGEFMTDGEEKAANLLRDELPEDWYIVCNKTYVTPRGRSWEIDEIIVAPHHVFVVDVKSIGGKVRGNEERWVLPSGESVGSPISKVDQLSRMLAGYLRQGMGGDADAAAHFVTGIVLLTGATDLHIIDARKNAQVIRLDAAVTDFADYDQQHRCVVVGRHRQVILERLRALIDAPRLPGKINAYRILERLADGHNYFDLLAEHEWGGGKALRRLKVYRLTDWPTEEDRQHQRELILRDWEALQALQSLPCVVHAEPPFYWDGEQFLVVPYQIPPGDSLSALQLQSTALTPVQDVRVALAILRELARVHQAGVVHRNLSPACIYVAQPTSESPEVSFTDFDFSRIPEAQTIAASDVTLPQSSPYVAPELRKGLAAATPASDVYSVGVILFELLAGQQASDYLQPDGALKLPEVPLKEAAMPAEFRDNLNLAVLDMTDADPHTRSSGADVATRWLTEALAAAQNAAEALPVPPDAGELVDNRYRVVRVLGSGATATTLLVHDLFLDERYVLKKINHPEWADQLTIAEFKALNSIPPHDGLVRVTEAWPVGKPYQLKMEYVDGPTLDELRGEFPWPLEEAMGVAGRLLGAIAHLERHRVYHRDISLRNIVIGPKGATLIDFGFARRADDAGKTGVGTLLFRAPEVDRNEGWHATSDLFSAAAVLYCLFTGILPFAAEVVPIDKTAVISASPDVQASLGEALIGVFRKALAADPDERYQTADELMAALQRGVSERQVPREREGERAENEWVTQLQSLYRNCRRGNSENRGADSAFADATYVPTRLDSTLLPAIVDERRFVAVFLTGNPGDGKTAFLEQVRTSVADSGGKMERGDRNGWAYLLEGHRFSANYDASESFKEKSADEVLTELLAPLSGDLAPRQGLPQSFLVAINDGRIRAFFHQNKRFNWLGRQVDRLLDHSGPADPRILVVDLKERSLVDAEVGRPSVDCLLERMLAALLPDSEWEVCCSCRARDVCPMKFNADTLRDPVAGPIVCARLKALFQMVETRRRRHATIRDTRSALSYLLTGVLACDDVHQAVDGEGPPLDWASRLYFNAVFNPDAERDDLLEELALLDPALVSAPRLERFLHYHRLPRQGAELEQVFLAEPSRGRYSVDRLGLGSYGSDWYRMMKRRFFFEAADDQESLADHGLSVWSELVPYRHFRRYMGILKEEEDLGDVLADLAEGVSRSDGLVDPSVTSGYLCVRTNHSDREELTVFKRFMLEEFRCRLLEGTADARMESLPLGLRLEASAGEPYLDIGLDLFEFLMRLLEGYRPDAPEQAPFVVDLALFKTRLLSMETNELVLMEAGRRLHRVVQSEGGIRREDVALSVQRIDRGGDEQ